MFHNRCRCCLATDRPLISVHTESSHKDNKTLEDYLNLLLKYNGQQTACLYPSEICLRCSKALQVAYHFIQMSQQRKKEFEKMSQQLAMATPTSSKTVATGKRAHGEMVPFRCVPVKGVMKNPIPNKLENVKSISPVDKKKPKLEINHKSQNEIESLAGSTPFVTIPVENNKMGNPKDIQNKMDNVVISLEVKKTTKLQRENVTGDDEETKSEWHIDMDSIKMEWKEQTCQMETGNVSENCMPWVDLRKREENLKQATNSIDSAGDFLIDKVVSRRFKCCYCDRSFALHESLIEHTQLIHKKMIPFKCKMCRFYTCFIESLYKHYKKNHALDDVENRLYKTKELLCISAEVEDAYEIALKCGECDFQAHTQGDIEEHLAEEHDIQDDKDQFTKTYYNCLSCHRQFGDKTSVKIHFSMSHNPQKTVNSVIYSCEKCDKTFNRKAGLVSHERYCEIRDPVQCNFCDLNFSTVFKYEQHLHTKHFVDIKHECEICRKTFKAASYLTVHRRRHNERYYQCNLCPNNYINNAELQVHLKRNHTHLYYKMCSICHKTFADEQMLREHMLKDHKKKSIQCNYCNFTSTSKFAMEVHQYRHTGKPYKCKICPKQYVLRKDLKLHSKKVHDLEITDEELATMFLDKHGYVSRFDAFSKKNNDLDIDVIDERDLEKELKEFDLTFEDIIRDLFNNNDEEEGCDGYVI